MKKNAEDNERNQDIWALSTRLKLFAVSLSLVMGWLKVSLGTGSDVYRVVAAGAE
jgi:hypothetical protein